MKLSILYFACCILLLFLLAMSPLAYAQGPGFDEDVEDVEVPIDGGVVLLAAAGVAYGIKKLKDAQKQKVSPADKPTD